jgi:MFS family permease
VRLAATDLEPFRVPAFRRYLLAATITSVSLWVYTTALNWTVLEATGSAAIVGLIFTLMTLPLPFATVPSGMLTDRLGPRGMMILALALEALCAGVTGLAAATGNLSVPLLLLVALLFGVADGLQAVPAQVLVGRIVPARQMTSAVGMSMLTIGVGRIVGGTAGGALVAGLGAGGSMLPAVIGLVAAAATIRTLPRVEGTGGGARLRRADLADGLRWFRATAGARALVLLAAVAALFVWPYLGLLAVVVRDLLEGDPADLGLLTASGGVGAILAALTMGPIGRRLGRGRQLVLVLLAAGAMEIALGLSHLLWPTLIIGTGLAMMTVTHSATSSLVIQAIAPVAMRGRALALYTFVFFGGLPIGYLVGGVAAERMGVGPLLIALGIATMAGTAAIAILDRRLLALDVTADPPEAPHPDTDPISRPATEPR